ncbi:MAG: GlsB/YeaQ/YmgE family stress response membrane protein [Pirellulales bacterium]
MGIIAWVVFGLIAGAIARTLVPGSGAYGLVVTAVIGVVGALVGGFIGTQLGFGEVDGFDIRSFAIAVMGSVLLLLGYRAVNRRNP